MATAQRPPSAFKSKAKGQKNVQIGIAHITRRSQHDRHDHRRPIRAMSCAWCRVVVSASGLAQVDADSRRSSRLRTRRKAMGTACSRSASNVKCPARARVGAARAPPRRAFRITLIRDLTPIPHRCRLQSPPASCCHCLPTVYQGLPPRWRITRTRFCRSSGGKD